MRIMVVDAQVLQTPALHRGMGKYSLELLRALLNANEEDKTWDHVELIVSSKIPLSNEASRQIGSLGRVNVTRLPLRKDIIYRAKDVMKKNRKCVDRHMATLKDKQAGSVIDYLILSPMQGGISSVFPSDPIVNRMAICYDLIPMMFHTSYFSNPIARIENLNKTTELLKADIFLAISQTVANDLSVYLGVDSGRITSIDGGPIFHAKAEEVYKVDRPYVLMPTGDDIRKNNRTGIIGFADFNKKHNQKYALVITSFFDPNQAAELSKLSPNIVFTGNVSGGELAYLYKNCEAMLFPSEYEGLGLPVLEAMEYDKPIACSDIAVFREISKTALIYFDPAYATSIASALEKAVGSKPDKAVYKQVLKKYNWQRSSRLLIETVRDIPPKVAPNGSRVVIFSANPEIDHPVARHTQLSYAELSRVLTTDYSLEGDSPEHASRANTLKYVNVTHSQSDGSVINPEDYSRAIYHIVDHSYFRHSLFVALAVPGIVVLHDTQLDAAWRSLLEGGLIDSSRFEAEKALSQKSKVKDASMLISLLSDQKAIVVFTRPAHRLVQAVLNELGSSAKVFLLNYPVGSLEYLSIIPDKTGKIAIPGRDKDRQIFEVFSQVQGAAEKWIISGGQDPHLGSVGDIKIKLSPLDKDLEEVISRLDAVFIDLNADWWLALEAAKYGVPSYAMASSLNLYRPTIPDFMVEINSSMDASLHLKDKKYYSASLTADDAKVRSYAAFAKELSNIVDQVG